MYSESAAPAALFYIRQPWLWRYDLYFLNRFCSWLQVFFPF
jgi:hypothetical protein